MNVAISTLIQRRYIIKKSVKKYRHTTPGYFDPHRSTQQKRDEARKIQEIIALSHGIRALKKAQKATGRPFEPVSPIVLGRLW